MAKSKQPGSKQDRQWAEAKRRCRLNQEDIGMARELGLKPRSLIKNLPSPQQQWKLPVKQWIHELQECKDIDLAVWVSDSGCLRAMQKARSRAVNQLWQEYGIG